MGVILVVIANIARAVRNIRMIPHNEKPWLIPVTMYMNHPNNLWVDKNGPGAWAIILRIVDKRSCVTG